MIFVLRPLDQTLFALEIATFAYYHFLDKRYLDESGFVEELFELLPPCVFLSSDRLLPALNASPKELPCPCLKERSPCILPSTLHHPSKHRAWPAFYRSHQSLCLAGEKERENFTQFQQTHPN